MLRILSLLGIGIQMSFISPVQAQQIIVTAGPATVQNISHEQFVASLGLGFGLNISSRISSELHYQRWGGSNHNLEMLLEDEESTLVGKEDFHANQGFGILARYSFLRQRAFRTSLGAGVAAYQFSVLSGDQEARSDEISGSTYHTALLLSLMTEWRTSRHIAWRAEIRSGFDDFASVIRRHEGSPSWLFLNVGLGYTL